jgi:hypothetical protein
VRSATAPADRSSEPNTTVYPVTAHCRPETDVCREEARSGSATDSTVHCIDGQADAANQRITDALGTTDAKPGPGDERDHDDSEQAS